MTPQSQTPRLTVACIVITYDRDDFIAACVQSLLRERRDDLGIQVTVINNGSPDNTAAVLEELARTEGISVVTKTQNMPLVEMMNESLAIGHAAGTEFIMTLNDDIEFRPGGIAEMVAVCGEVPHALVTPLQINYRKPDELDPTMLERLRGSDALLNDLLLRGEMKRYYQQDALIGAALLGRAETFAAIGDYDTLFNFYGPDDDYCNRAVAMGIPQLVATQAEMLHMHGRIEHSPQTSKASWLRRWSRMYRARMIFILKDRGHSVFGGYLRAAGRMLADMLGYIVRGWPRGILLAAGTLVSLTKAYGRVRDRRAQEDAQIAAFRTKQQTAGG